ncbi:MAG: DUF885 domain-containing protein [Gemmatimonadetes bacterium]|nr:DUF885 domain-containing protein [Gemmatimonadota bacterium]
MTGPHTDGSLDAFFDALVHLRPVDATFIGIHDQDHRLPDWSPAGHQALAQRWRAVGEALGATHDLETAVRAGDWATIDRAVAHSHVDVTLAELASRHFTRGNPSLAVGEAAFSVIGLITREFAPAAQRASYLLPRLRAIPRFLAGAMASIADGPVPSAWVDRALRETRALERLLTEGLPIWCREMALADDRSQALVDAAQGAAGAVHGATEALNNLKRDAVDARPAGEELLTTCIRSGHWMERSIDDLLQEARDALREHQALLAERVREAQAGSLAEVLARLAAAHPSVADYYGAFQRCWDACRATSDAHGLVTWPDAPIRYVAIPEWTRMAAPSLYYLFYRSPAPFDTYPVYDYVVTPIEGLDDVAAARHLAAWNNATIKLNHVVHHGALGHHVQNWYAYRAPSRVARIAAADCASRIAMLQGGTMAEGWACYATDLMEEVGFLTPDERVSEQHTRVRMLARAIVDLEFHTERRSFADAITLYVDEVGMTPEMARAEATKNSMFPGTAMMYWFGTQGVHTLRRLVAAREGAAFSLRDFHDRFLAHGALPVALISRLMTAER